MTKLEKLSLIKDRYNRLKENPKDLKSPGAVKKLLRQIRNMEKEI